LSARVEISRANPGDYAGILRLQAANYSGNLTAQERAGGFLSAQFTPAQIATMAEDLGIMVAREAGVLAGYLCAHRADLAPLPPVVAEMLRCCRSARCGSRVLGETRLFVYGPVCIARAARGAGVLRALYSALLAQATGLFDYGVTLVAEENPHSLRAHTLGLGMHDLARFEHAGRRYHLLAFDVAGEQAPP
jgi:hypothetical protein